MSWHRHAWEPYFAEYNEPLPKEDRHHVTDSSAYQRQAFGFTNITMKCRKCPATKIEQHPGKVNL